MRFEEWMSRHFPTLPANWAIKLWDDAQPENMLHARAQLEQEWASLKAMQRMAQNPIDMVLYCPACGTQHIDAPAPAPGAPKYFENTGPDDRFTPPWNNPPHRSHLCAACGVQWRPADVPTNGVAKLKTAGQNDTPVIRSLKEISDEYNWVRNVLADHGYDGPLGDGCCPLREWLSEAPALQERVTYLEATCEALSEQLKVAPLNVGGLINMRKGGTRRISRETHAAYINIGTWTNQVSCCGETAEEARHLRDTVLHALRQLTEPRVTLGASVAEAHSAAGCKWLDYPERVAQLVAHRAVGSEEHAPTQGKLHGCCAVCLVPWPCEYAGEPPAKEGIQISHQMDTKNLHSSGSYKCLACGELWPCDAALRVQANKGVKP